MKSQTIERFSQLIDSYGAEVKRWPVDERVAALKLLETSETARHLQQSALNLDNLLDDTQILKPSPQLRNRILNTIKIKPRKEAWQWLGEWLMGTTLHEHILRPAFAVILPLLLGISLGLNLNSMPESEQTWFEEEINLLALGPME